MLFTNLLFTNLLVLGYICRYRKALYFGSLEISLYLELFILVSCLLLLFFYVSLRNLCFGTCRKIPMLAISAKLVVIFPHMSVNISFQKGPRTFSNVHSLSSEGCRQSCSADCFEILVSAPTKFQLKLKEAMHINWGKLNLNQQVHHVNLTLTL